MSWERELSFLFLQLPKGITSYLESALNNNYAANVFLVIFLSVPYLYRLLFFLLKYGLFGSVTLVTKCKTTIFFQMHFFPLFGLALLCVKHTVQAAESQSLEAKREGAKCCRYKDEMDAIQNGME